MTNISNDWSIVEAVRATPCYWPTTTGGKWKPHGAQHLDRAGTLPDWEAVRAAHPEVAEWATIGAGGGSPWFPASFVPAIQELRYTSSGRHPRCVVGAPCEVMTSTDMGRSTSFNTCARPIAEGQLAAIRFRGPERVPVCKLHGAHQRKQDERDAESARQRQERQQREEHRSGMDQASAEWAQRLAEELGIRAERHRHHSGAEHLRVLVEPERLYRQLVDLMGELRDLGLEELYPFKPGEVSGR